MDIVKLLRELILESKMEKSFFKSEVLCFSRWNMRNRFLTELSINRWACLMVSSQRPHPNQLSMAKQFVDEFPQVNSLMIPSNSEEFFAV